MKPEEINFKRHTHGGLVAIILIFFGAVFLLNNFNPLPGSFWKEIWKFWPVILILWGLQSIFGRSLINHLLLILLTTSAVFLLLSYFTPDFGNYLNSWLLYLQVK